MIASGDNRDDPIGDAPAANGPAAGVAMLVDAGLPLEAGLRALGEEVPSLRLRRVLGRMSSELAAGESADEVLSRSGRGLPRYIRGLTRAGVQSGQLGTFLAEFLAILQRRKKTLLEWLLPLLNPLILVPLTLWGVGTLVSLLTSQFIQIYSDFGVELPAITLLLLRIGQLATVRTLISFVGVVVLMLLLVWVLRFLVGAATWTRTMQRIPLVGTNSRMRGLSEFCSLLGLLVSGNVPLPEALAVTSGALKDANLKAGSRKLAARAEEGESLYEGACRLDHFSPELRNLFRWENRGAAFGEILRQAGIVFAARSRVHLGLIWLIVPPLTIVFVGGLLALTVIALYMPLIKLLNELS